MKIKKYSKVIKKRKLLLFNSNIYNKAIKEYIKNTK